MAASILIDGVAGPELDAALSTLVALTNADNTGVVTWEWTLVDKPSTSAASIVNPTAATANLTPDCEGTYLIQLRVNYGLATEATDRTVLAVLQLKTGLRVPAASETTEAESTRGWASSRNEAIISFVDGARADPNVLVANNAGASSLNVGDIVYVSAVSTIKAGLPDEETIAGATAASAAAEDTCLVALYLVTGAAIGGGPTPAGELALLRRSGLATGLSSLGATAGDVLYLNDAGSLSLTPGTVTRVVGIVIADDTATMDVFFDGSGISRALALVDLVLSGNILLNGTGTQSITKDGTGNLKIGTDNAAKVQFKVGANTAWEIDNATYALQGVGGNQPIKAVLDPTLAQDAATKNYVDLRTRAILAFGNATITGGGVTEYLAPWWKDGVADATERGYRVPTSGTLRNLYVRARVAGGVAGVDFTVRVNGAPSALTANLPLGNLNASDTTHSVAVTAGNVISVEAKPAGGATSPTDIEVTFELY